MEFAQINATACKLWEKQTPFTQKECLNNVLSYVLPNECEGNSKEKKNLISI